MACITIIIAVLVGGNEMNSLTVTDIDNLRAPGKMTMDRIPDYCDEAFDARTFEEEFPGRRSRQRLCKFLGIAESTLSGWLKEDRIPLMAKEAYVLFRAVEALSQEIGRVKVEAEDFKILESNGRYLVCELGPNEDGEVIGKIVADNIRNIQDARMLVSGKKISRLLRNSMEVYYDRLDDTENDNYIWELEEQLKEIDRTLGYANNLEKWKQEKTKEEAKKKKLADEAFDSL